MKGTFSSALDAGGDAIWARDPHAPLIVTFKLEPSLFRGRTVRVIRCLALWISCEQVKAHREKGRGGTRHRGIKIAADFSRRQIIELLCS